MMQDQKRSSADKVMKTCSLVLKVHLDTNFIDGCLLETLQDCIPRLFSIIKLISGTNVEIYVFATIEDIYIGFC